MKVALVHDFLQTYGDAERLLAVLHQIYPQAPVFTAFIDRPSLGPDWAHFANWDLRPTWGQKLPAIARQPERYRPLLPYIWESVDLSGFDLVISSSAGFLSHAVLPSPSALHICYCHTPSRSLWEPNPYSTLTPRWFDVWSGSRLRQYDFYAAQRLDRLFTNSETVAHRIKKFYRRTADVVPPPVKIAADGKAGERYYLYVGALTPNQQVDRVIQACNQMQRPLVVVGTGSEQSRLRQLAGETIQFVERPSEAELGQLYSNTRALIFPSADADFGFSPVEAMGRGIPVIACEQSGIREIVLNYRTGLLFAEPTVENLCQAIAQFEGLRFFSHACIQRAEEFAESVFVDRFKWLVAQALDEHRQKGTISAN
ncbi:MAG TPA: glycosyltransferase [Leptolyngbyaceae cyanobacterium M33_DOE_097]|uniref:Glycosyltransferase family 4 protein n=1 Tax=Oscillatoriales cyanobacterium SpSt-418 TaxID=2282169 RepID=A0A7C3PG46_9CYAN|nr:glycosyltransferase [Leptolyngbyaceae cyanobacterium M33_DOE_097]